jgi:hypothetical protein
MLERVECIVSCVDVGCGVRVQGMTEITCKAAIKSP